LADIFTKGLVAHQFQKLAARLMGWTYVRNDGISGEDSREHSSGLDTRQMRGSDAGHMTAGQGLTAGQRSVGPGLLSRQARSSPIQPVCQATWMVSGHGSRLVHESTAKVPVVLRLQWLQQLQLGHMQWYQVDLTTGLRQSYPATGRPTRLWLWYQVHTGTGLQQQVLGYVVCYGWLWQQQPGCRLARPHTSTHPRQGKACMVVPRILRQWQQVQAYRQARLRRSGTQARQQGHMPEYMQNYQYGCSSSSSKAVDRLPCSDSVPRLLSMDQVCVPAHSCHRNYSVLWLCIVDRVLGIGTQATNHGPMHHNG